METVDFRVFGPHPSVLHVLSFKVCGLCLLQHTNPVIVLLRRDCLRCWCLVVVMALLVIVHQKDEPLLERTTSSPHFFPSLPGLAFSTASTSSPSLRVCSARVSRTSLYSCFHIENCEWHHSPHRCQDVEHHLSRFHCRCCLFYQCFWCKPCPPPCRCACLCPSLPCHRARKIKISFTLAAVHGVTLRVPFQMWRIRISWHLVIDTPTPLDGVSSPPSDVLFGGVLLPLVAFNSVCFPSPLAAIQTDRACVQPSP